MTLDQLKDWLPFLETAPEGIREYLIGTFWILVFLLLVWAILKLVFNQDFKKLYKVLGSTARVVGEVSKRAAKEAAESLELPEPYPRLTKLFAIIFMLVNYATCFMFSSFFLVFVGLFVTADIPSFLSRLGGMMFSALLFFFAWFFFAQAERDRVRLFKREND